MTEPKWTRKIKSLVSVLCLEGGFVEILFTENTQEYQIWVLGKKGGIYGLLAHAKRDGQHIAEELYKIGVSP